MPWLDSTVRVAWRYRQNLWADAIERSTDPIRRVNRHFVVFVFPPGFGLVDNGKAENCVLVVEASDLKFGHVFKAEVNLRVILEAVVPFLSNLRCHFKHVDEHFDSRPLELKAIATV